VVPESGSPPDDVDHGSAPDTTLPYEVDPVLTDPQGDGGTEADPGSDSDEQPDGSGPIEKEPVDDPDGGLQLTDPAVPGGLDSETLPVPPTAPAPPTGTPAAPDDTADAPLAASPEAINRATWLASDRKRRVPRTRLSGNPRPPAERPVASEPDATGTPAVSSEPVSAAVSVAAPLGPGRFHVVRPGESLWSIASRLLGRGASDGAVALEVRRLWRLNAERIGTGDPSLLRVGVRLRVR